MYIQVQRYIHDMFTIEELQQHEIMFPLVVCFEIM